MNCANCACAMLPAGRLPQPGMTFVSGDSDDRQVFLLCVDGAPANEIRPQCGAVRLYHAAAEARG